MLKKENQRHLAGSIGMACNSFFLFLFFYLRDGKSVSGGEAERQGEGESQAGSALNVEPKGGLDPTTLGS